MPIMNIFPGKSLSVLCLLTLLASIFLPVTPVAAAMSILISPTSGAVGTSISLNGTIDGAGNSYDILWDNVFITSGSLATGSVNVARTFNAPLTTGGNHTVTLRDSGTMNTASTTFTVVASIAMTPTTGTIGTTITVNGSGFDAGETNISVTYDANPIKTGLSADTTGSWTTTIIIPDSPSGTARAIGATRGTIGASSPANINLTVTPSMTVTPTTGSVGTSISITGKGFTASETGISVTIDSEVVKSGIIADTNGSWTSSFALPDVPGGIRVIDSYGSTTAATSVADINFTVGPGLVVSPVSGITGTPITVNGSGFSSNETSIVVTFGNVPVAQGIQANARGRWTATFTAPAGAGGSRNISAYGNVTGTTQVPSASFSIMAQFSINPTSGKVGTEVSASGSSFGVNEAGIGIFYDGAALPSRFTADANGTWKTTFTVPPSTTGNHRVSAAGTFTQITSVPEQSFGVSADLTVSPDSGFVGTVIAVSGTGFTASRPVAITYDGQSVTTSPSQPSTTPQGNLTATFPAPKSKGGAHKIRVTDGPNTRETEWKMDSAPPPKPALINPTNGERISWYYGPDPIPFKWSAVEDPSGVTYTLEVAETDSFTSPVLRKDGLTKPEFTTDPMEQGGYFWRVRAIDGADNASEWTGSFAVSVGLMPMWGFIAAAAAILIGFGIIIALLLRRKPGAPRMREERIPKPKKVRRLPELPEPEPTEAEEYEEEPEPEPSPPPRPSGKKQPRQPEPAQAPPQPSAPVVDQAEIDEVVMRVVDGLTDTDVSLLAQNEELRQRGWTLARLYKTIGRLEQEGKLVRGQDEKYRRAGPSKGAAPPSKAITGKPPVEVAEEPTEEPQEAPPPKAAARPVPSPEEPRPTARKAPEPEPTPPPPPPAVDIMDPELAQLVADTVSGLTDADITQVAQSEIIRSRGLNLAKVYKIVSRLEKEGKLVRDADGKYQPPDKASTKAQAKEPKSFDWDQPLAARGKQAESRGLDDYKTFEAPADKTIAPSKTPPPAAASPAEMMDIVAGAIVGQTDADIPQIAQQPSLKARGLNLAKLYQIASRLEKEGRIARDDKGRYQLSISKPSPPAAEAVPAKRFTSLEWSANLPWLSWQTFETKVLNKFTGEESLSITVAFRVGPGASLSSEKVEETRAALAGLQLDTALKSDPAEGAPGRFSSLEWSGALPVKNWEPYYAQVLSRFFAEKTLSINVSLKVAPGTGITQAKADELASGLKDMSLPAALKLS